MIPFPTPLRTLTALLPLLLAAGGAALHAQPAEPLVRAVALPPAAPAVPGLRVTDPRLAAALEVLVAASPTAARTVEALAHSGLPVAIGTPRQLASLPDSAGGPGARERRALLSAETADAEGMPVAWVVFRVGGAEEPAAGAAPTGEVERVWVAVEADSVEGWIARTHRGDATMRVAHDLLAILAHEFVAHVGSVAASRRMEDFCDDPTPEQRRRTRQARLRGELAPLDGEAAACSLRVENRVRRELNRALGLRGADAFRPRDSYVMDPLHFAVAAAHR